MMVWGPQATAVLTVAVTEAAWLPVLTLLPPPLFAVFRQLNTAIAVSQMSSGQCRLAPLIQVIQDCSHLYHYTVKLMFKLHACKSPSTLPQAPRGSAGAQRAVFKQLTLIDIYCSRDENRDLS